MNFDPRAFLRQLAAPAVVTPVEDATEAKPVNGSPAVQAGSMPVSPSAEASVDIARFEVGSQQLGAVKRQKGKLQTDRAYRLFWALRARGLNLKVEVKTDLLVGPARDLTSAERRDIQECAHELAAMAPAMMSRAEADAFTRRMEASAVANNDWGIRSLKYLVVCRRHQCIASAKTTEKAQEYVDDHRNLDRCPAEISVRGA